ncbi:MAG: DAK2 domain-containing protein [Pseudomonadota bacterium]
MSDLETARRLAGAALASLEANRRRIDDLNVYPVPDGDTGTNLTLTVRGVVAALDGSSAADRATVTHELTRAALMSARGNSGVILSQIVRGAAEALATADAVDAGCVARAFRGASDAAYRAVRKPVEGTMLTVVRSIAEAAEHRAHPELDVGELLLELVRQGEETLARTPELLDVLREAGVVDAGGAGLVEIVRGIAAAVRGEPLPEAAAVEEELPVDAVHQELSEFRYCTVFVVEGEALDTAELERELDRLGDSLLVVGDETALKVHVHTDDPGAALSLGVRQGTIDRVEIANMHRQTLQREERLTDHTAADEDKTTEVVAVVAGEGNRRLFASLGAGRIIEGGQTMNPSTQDIVAAIESTSAPEVIVLPNNSNVVMSAEQAARLASKPVRVIHTESIPAGLAALVVYDAARSAEANVGEMHEALGALATGAVTVASRDAEVDGVVVRKGEFLGLVEDQAVASGAAFEDVARVVLDRLLAAPRDVLTLLTGAEAPPLNGLRAWVEERHPELEVEVQDGGQPHYPLLVSAE